MSDHSDCDITVTQVWATGPDGNQCQESAVHCDTHNVDL